MITEAGKQVIAEYIQSIISSGKVGIGGNSTNPINNDLDSPLSGATVVKAVSTNNNIMEIKLSISGNTIQGQVIRELGIFDDANTNADITAVYTGEDNMLIRQNFSGVGPFSTSETLELFLILEVEWYGK